MSNIAHTPDTGACGVAMALDFVRLAGSGVPRAALTLGSAAGHTRVTGKVGGRRVALRLAATT